MIEMKDISKAFGSGRSRRVLFHNFSFEIAKGEMVAIMGKSGSDKTTLLNIIGGLEALDEGEYLFEGKEVSKMNEKELLNFRRNHISFVFQNFALINEYTVEENILLPLGYKFGNKTKQKKKKSEYIFGTS